VRKILNEKNDLNLGYSNYIIFTFCCS